MLFVTKLPAAQQIKAQQFFLGEKIHMNILKTASNDMECKGNIQEKEENHESFKPEFDFSIY